MTYQPTTEENKRLAEIAGKEVYERADGKLFTDFHKMKLWNPADNIARCFEVLKAHCKTNNYGWILNEGCCTIYENEDSFLGNWDGETEEEAILKAVLATEARK